MPRRAADGAGDAARSRWVRWLTAGTLVLVSLLLVPPGSLPYRPGAFYSDAAIAHWPNAYFLRQSIWVHGQIPLWNPLRMLGQPFAANPLAKVWYPPQWLVLIIPPTLHLNLMIALHFGWLALGMAAWAHAEGLRPLAGAFAALAWGLNPKLIAHLGAGHLDIVYALAWTPWLLWAVRRAADEPQTEHAALLGGVAAMLALADLRIAFYMLPSVLVYGLALVRRRDRARRGAARAAVLAGGLFMLLTAVQTAPLAVLGPYLTRATITPEEAAAYSLPPRYLAGMLIADAGGFHEWMTYIGVPVLALAVLSFARRERFAEKMACAVLAIGGLLWALGEHGPLFPLAARWLPPVSWFRVPPRAWLVTVLALVLLAAWGLDELLRHGLPGKARAGALGLALTGLVWLGASQVMLPGLPPLSGFGAALAGTGLSLVLLDGGLPLRAIDPRLAGSGVLLATLLASLLLLDRTLVEGRPVTISAEVDRAILASLGGFCDGVYSPSFDLIGSAAASAGVPTLHGVDPFQLQWSAEAIARAAGVEPSGYSVVAPPLPPGGEGDPAQALRGVRPDAGRLAALGVRWVVAHFAIEADGLRLHEQVDDVYLYETSGSPPVLVAPGEAARPLTPDAQRVHGVCNRPPNRPLDAWFDSLPFDGDTVLIVVPQAWAPGWQARVDGRHVPVERVGGVFVGVPVPVLGTHHVEVVYRPLADLVGAGVSGTTVLAAAGWLLRRRAAWPVPDGRGKLG